MSPITGNIKPSHGLRVRLRHRPGIWECLDKSPHKAGEWWMIAADDEARESGDIFDQATYRDMKPVRSLAA